MREIGSRWLQSILLHPSPKRGRRILRNVVPFHRNHTRVRTGQLQIVHGSLGSQRRQRIWPSQSEKQGWCFSKLVSRSRTPARGVCHEEEFQTYSFQVFAGGRGAPFPCTHVRR